MQTRVHVAVAAPAALLAPIELPQEVPGVSAARRDRDGLGGQIPEHPSLCDASARLER